MSQLNAACRLAGLFLVVMIAGCGGDSSADPSERVTAQASYDTALAAFESEDYATAQTQFEAALKGELTVDLYTDTLLKLAVCHAHQQQFDEAMNRLSEAEQGAAPEDVDSVRSQIQELQKG